MKQRLDLSKTRMAPPSRMRPGSVVTLAAGVVAYVLRHRRAPVPCVCKRPPAHLPRALSKGRSASAWRPASKQHVGPASSWILVLRLSQFMSSGQVLSMREWCCQTGSRQHTGAELECTPCMKRGSKGRAYV